MKKDNEQKKSKAGLIDKRINDLVKAFDEFRHQNQITVTETFMLLRILEFKVKNEIDNHKTTAFLQGFGFDEILNESLRGAEKYFDR